MIVKLLALLALIPERLLASNYVPLAPIPGAVDNFIAAGETADLSSTLVTFYNFGIGAAAALAVIMVIWGGIEYMTTDAIGHHEEGKQKIQSAILGLLLALSSYIILQTINRDLLKTDFNPTKLGQLPAHLLQPQQMTLNASGQLLNPEGYVIIDPQTGQPMMPNKNAPYGGGSGYNPGFNGWGSPEASSMMGQTMANGRFYYYGPNETGQFADSGTAAGKSALGNLYLFNPNNPNMVSSSASVYYPAGTIWSHKGSNGQTYYHIVDDNNIDSKTGRPANNLLTRPNAFDLPVSGNPNTISSQDSTNYPSNNANITVHYVPQSRPSNSQIESLRDANTLHNFLQNPNQ